MPSFRTFGLFAFLTCLTALSLAQVSSFVNPEEIDIYSFDPSAQLKDAPTSYTAKGYEAYSKADYETAAQYYLAHLQSNPTDAGSWYNLSCCFGLLGKSELAAKYLQMAYKNRFRDLDHISRDSDFDKVVAYEEATKAFSTLEAAGFKNLRLDQFEGAHSISPNAFKLFLEWIK